jgi:hypothetical protein
LIVLLHETLVTKSGFFVMEMSLKFTHEHLQFKKNFLGSLALAINGKGRGRMGAREGRGKEKGSGGRQGS